MTQKKANGYSNKGLLKISFVFASLLTILTLAMITIGTEFSGSIQSIGLFIIGRARGRKSKGSNLDFRH